MYIYMELWTQVCMPTLTLKIVNIWEMGRENFKIQSLVPGPNPAKEKKYEP